MTAIAVLFGIGLMTLFFAKVEETRYNPNSSPSSRVYEASVEVPLVRNHYGHYVVTGHVNGQEVDFLLDTGATDVVVPESIAKAAGLSYGQRSRAMTANGVITVWRTRIDQLTIGDIQLRDVPASINPHSEDAILLGMSALGQIEFVQSGETLTLKQKFL